MNLHRAALTAPIASIMILVLGSGFYTTLTTMHLKSFTDEPLLLGCVSSVYFCGLVISGFKSQYYIFRVGHIRAFATFAAVIAVATLLQGLYYSVTLWIALRFISGYCLAGLCVIIESWLMGTSTSENRGSILAIYMIAYYLAQAISQLFVSIDFTDFLVAYCLIAIFSTLSLVPVCMTRFSAPAPEQPHVLSFAYLFRRVPLGVVGCICAGMMLGAIYTITPNYLLANDKTNESLSYVMTAIILGGTLLQYPLGRLSDHIDRRKILVGINLAAILFFVLFIPDIYNTPWLVTLGFCMGGAAFTIYPVSISHAIDHVSHEDMISAISALLLAYGIGSAIGPFVATAFMQVLGHNGLCFYLLAISVGMFTYALWRIFLPTRDLPKEPVEYVALPSTTPESMPVEVEVTSEDGEEVSVSEAKEPMGDQDEGETTPNEDEAEKGESMPIEGESVPDDEKNKNASEKQEEVSVESIQTIKEEAQAEKAEEGSEENQKERKEET